VQTKEVGTPLELRVRSTDGWRLVEMIGAPLGPDLLLSVRDLTERRRWEVAGDEVARFRSLMQNAASVTMLLTSEGVVESSSGGLTRLLGLDQEWLEGRPLGQDLAGRDPDIMIETFLSVLYWFARPSIAGRGDLPTRKVNAKHPPKARCAIRTKAGSGLRAVSARLLTKFEALDVVRPSYLSCSTTVLYIGARRYRAALVLNARDLKATTPPLPAAPNSISARRAGPGWLVVFGGRTNERKRVLRALRVTAP